MTTINTDLLKQARDHIELIKKGFVPAGGGQGQSSPMPQGGDPSVGGDPAAGGAPPAPPPDPAAGGGGVGAGGPDMSTMVNQAVQQAMQQQQMMGGGGMGGPPKAPKMDPNQSQMDIFQLKKLVLHSFRTICNALNIPFEIPPDILDGPSRDPRTGLPTAPNAPGSTSDPAKDTTGGAGAAGGDQQSAIQPIQPIQGASPQASGGAVKTSDDKSPSEIGREFSNAKILSKAAALALVLRRRKELQAQ